ncbi:hypothetical protein BGP_6581 [Beggiatoa sp. PS]|nr:hypothetical protein BGP_6581 [Beggiatoa sp. PS]
MKIYFKLAQIKNLFWTTQPVWFGVQNGFWSGIYFKI